MKSDEAKNRFASPKSFKVKSSSAAAAPRPPQPPKNQYHLYQRIPLDVVLSQLHPVLHQRNLIPEYLFYCYCLSSLALSP